MGISELKQKMVPIYVKVPEKTAQQADMAGEDAALEELKYTKRKQFGRLTDNKEVLLAKKQRFSSNVVSNLLFRVKDEKLRKGKHGSTFGDRRYTIDGPMTQLRDPANDKIESARHLSPLLIPDSSVNLMGSARLFKDPSLYDTQKTSVIFREPSQRNSPRRGSGFLMLEEPVPIKNRLHREKPLSIDGFQGMKAVKGLRDDMKGPSVSKA